MIIKNCVQEETVLNSSSISVFDTDDREKKMGSL